MKAILAILAIVVAGCSSVPDTVNRAIIAGEKVESLAAIAIAQHNVAAQKALEGNPVTNADRAEARARVAAYRSKRDLAIRALVELQSLLHIGPALLAAYSFGSKTKNDLQAFMTGLFNATLEEVRALKALGLDLGVLQ